MVSPLVSIAGVPVRVEHEIQIELSCNFIIVQLWCRKGASRGTRVGRGGGLIHFPTVVVYRFFVFFLNMYHVYWQIVFSMLRKWSSPLVQMCRYFFSSLELLMIYYGLFEIDQLLECNTSQCNENLVSFIRDECRKCCLHFCAIN